ncbi:MAG: putative ferredoxin--NADP(+) reductase [Chloroflexi bacterium OLB14]|nr:MAG: putative ferredoxin--NADP(+) reductase [Chloroflexi bacterium OLB14]
METQKYVAVIGAGPAGLFGARELANNGVRVALFNRDIKVGGLAEYGIFLDKHTMKEGLRKQFRQALENPNIDYYGNVSIGNNADFTIDEICKMGFDAILVSAGAQGTKWLGLEGEDLEGVYHAKDLVYHYNGLPPFSQKKFHLGKRCAIIGAGNVMIDIARYLIYYCDAEEITAIVRRGPADVNFTKEEMKHLIGYLDMQDFENEMNRMHSILDPLHIDVEVGRAKILESLPKADAKTKNAKFRFELLASPARMIGENGILKQLEIEENILVEKDGRTSAKGTGKKHLLDVDTVIFAIGDKVDEDFGLPTQWNEFVKNENPKFPIDNISYETNIEGVFVGGWSRKASEGLVGLARKDGTHAAKAVLAYLGTKENGNLTPEDVQAKLKNLNKPIITKEDIKKLEAVEADEAQKRGLEEFKFTKNDEMLKVLGY